MKKPFTALLVLAILVGCDGSNEKAPTTQAAGKSGGGADYCMMTGPNSPIVTGGNSVVVIDGKTYVPGQSANCAPASTTIISTHGVGSPIVTGAGSKVIIHVEQ